MKRTKVLIMIIVFSIVFTSNVFSTNVANEDYLSNEYYLNNFVEVSEELLEDYPFKEVKHPTRESIDISDYEEFFTGPYQRANTETSEDEYVTIMSRMREYSENNIIYLQEMDTEIAVNNNEFLDNFSENFNSALNVDLNSAEVNKKLDFAVDPILAMRRTISLAKEGKAQIYRC